MGLLDDYGIDVENEVPDGPNNDVPDDWYEFELANVFIQNGTSGKPDSVSVVFDYLLGEDGKKKSEWFHLPEDPTAPTDKELSQLSFYKQRLLSLGVSREALNTVSSDDLIGLRGTLQVFTNNKGYQNIKNVKLAEEDVPAPTTAPTVKAPAARKAPAAAAASTVKKNPFAK